MFNDVSFHQLLKRRQKADEWKMSANEVSAEAKALKGLSKGASFNSVTDFSDFNFTIYYVNSFELIKAGRHN